MLPKGVNIAYAIIPSVTEISEPLQGQVRDAFADGVSLIWKVLIGVSGAGFLSSLLMREIPLHTETDNNWGLNAEGVMTPETAVG